MFAFGFGFGFVGELLDVGRLGALGLCMFCLLFCVLAVECGLPRLGDCVSCVV